MEPDKRLYRTESNRMIAGVAGGLGAYFDTDPTIFRLGFVALAFLGGSGIVAYLVAWIIVPPESRPDTPPESVPQDNLGELREGIQGGARGARESLERWPGQGGKDSEPLPQPSSADAPAPDAEPPDEAPARDLMASHRPRSADASSVGTCGGLVSASAAAADCRCNAGRRHAAYAATIAPMSRTMPCLSTAGLTSTPMERARPGVSPIAGLGDFSAQSAPR